MRKYLLLIIFANSFLMSCKDKETPPATIPETTNMTNILPEWAKASTIYEVNIRQYTPEGTINAFSDHIPRLKDLGVEILWLMPVFPISETKKKGTLGSYYAVTDYTEVNPAFGTKQDLINLIEKIHAYKMRVILDWVPNHTGWDHKWIASNPDFYTKDSTGNITDPIDPNTGKSHGWSDVADLNYDNMEMRKAMTEDLIHWVKEHKIDGYRMDIAFGVPNDYWQQLKDTLMTINPNLFMLAESEDPSHLNDDLFHACYGWGLHHIMNDIANDRKSLVDYKTWRKEQLSKYQKGSLMHFITNHDENSWNGSEHERMGDAYQAFAVLVQTIDGIPLIYSGQEEPLNKRLEFFEKDDIGFKNYASAKFYKDLIEFKKQNPALWNSPYGAEIQEITNNDHVYAFTRQKDNNVVYVLINLSNQDRKVTLDEPIKGVKDIFTKENIDFQAGEEYLLKPWQFVIGSKN